MLKRIVVLGVALAALMFTPLMRSQSAPPQSPTAKDQAATPATQAIDGWGRPVPTPAKDQKLAPAPIHDISGTWEPANGALDGLGIFGAKAMPEDGKPEHQLPYTPAGLEALSLKKPTFGPRSVLPAETNDPVVYCDPQGIPREDLNQFRTTQILQTPLSVVILYQFGKVWRVVWTDGRQPPKDPEPRWYGYSVGKWVDDYTLVVQTSGTDDRTWVDHVGRPHSEDLRVEERFHRVDHDHLELTVTIDDPKMYSKPWVALDRFPMRLQPPGFDVREMICSPSETAEYNRLVGNVASEKDTK
ncbi:MAG TPA: hypothetical protein VGT24_05750 [Candidatus Acidoferrales bacterium]|nr:hypothetical protein [Candidatus Acidoferrales bacterium]